MSWRNWVCFFVKFIHQGAFIKQHGRKYDLSKKTVRVLSFKGDWRRPSLVIFVPFLNPELNETEQPVLAKD